MIPECHPLAGARRGCSLACLLALTLLHREPTTALAQVPAATSTGRISGNVYRADSGAPLGDITITVQQTSGSYWTAKSALDGSYEINGLPPDGFWLGAYSEGFVGTFYGNYNGSAPVKLAPGGSASGIDIRLPVLPKITKIPVDALAAAYPVAINSGRFFTGGRFSPDGSQIAIMLGDITVSAAEQVWIHDFRSARLIPVTGIPRRDRRSQIQSVAWDEDGTLYIKGIRGNPGETFYVAVKDERTRVVDRPPDALAAVFQSGAGPEDVQRAFRRSENVVVTTENEGHGDIRLRVQTGTETIEIAQGNWELESFILDRERDRVLYPVARFPAAIAMFDLKAALQTHEVIVQAGMRSLDIRLLDQTRDGTRAAYTVYGSCLPGESLKDGVLLRMAPAQESTPPRALCVVELPSGERSN